MSSPARLVRRATAAFVAIAIAVGAVVSLGAVWIADAITRADLVADAEETAVFVHRGLVAALMAEPDRPAADHFADVLLPQVQAGTLVRVKVWERIGPDRLRIVYSDLPELVGDEKRLRPDRAELLGTSGTLVLPMPDDAAHRTELALGRDLVEVFTAFSSGGADYLLESYFETSTEDKTARLRAHLLPVVLGGMALFALAMLPLAASLARRLSRAERERAVLIDRATRVRENERVRLGQRLHDGVVQDLAGASLALSALASSARPDQEQIAAVARLLQRDVQSLRGLLDDLVPVELDWSELRPALQDLADESGLAAGITVTGGPGPGPQQTALVYSAARELLSNVTRHAEARTVTIEAASDRDGVRLTVSDDGRGFDPSTPTPEGHVGLRIVERAARSAGGGLDVVSAPGEGTTVTMRIAADG